MHRELDVSCARSLRSALRVRAAVEAVECGEAQEIMAAYFDRLFRSLTTQREALERVERHGGRIGAVDFGHISDATVSQLAVVDDSRDDRRHHSRSTRERTAPVRQLHGRRAGSLSSPPLGMFLDADRHIYIDEDMRELMSLVFAARVAGESKRAIKRLLAEHGHDVTIRGVEAILGQALYMGELRSGKLPNGEPRRVNRDPFRGVEPIVDRRTFERVQAMKTPSGRVAPSERLLARLGVLRCACCGSKMSAGGQWATYVTASGETRRTRYAFYKCGMFAECAAPSSISAENVERYVVELTKQQLSDIEERESSLREARRRARRREHRDRRRSTRSLPSRCRRRDL